MQSVVPYLSKLASSTHNLALVMEEQSRKPGLCGKFILILLNSTLAEKMSKFYKLLLFNPLHTAVGVLIVYVVFCIIFFPLYLFSFILTSSGSVILLLFLIVLGARSFARLMTFPGSSPSVARDMSSDVMRRLSVQYENMSSITSAYVSTLALLLSGRVARFDVDLIVGKFRELQGTVASFQATTESLNESFKLCTGVRVDNSTSSSSATPSAPATLKPQESEMIRLAMSSIDSFHRAYLIFDPIVASFCSKLQSSKSISEFASSKRMSSSSATVAFNPDTIITREERDALSGAIAALARASDELRAHVTAHLRPAANTGEKDLVTQVVTSVCQLNQGPSGVELLAYPFMRQQVKRGYRAEELLLTGSDGQLIDAIYVPSKNRSHATDTANQSVGTVLFCCPNAGLYECVSMSIGLPCSWNSFYYNLGFDLVYFNYRGYGRSAGVPTPDRVKSDAERVMEHIRRERPPRRMIIHGESLGGMVACHLARKYKIDLLVCDRTFASLDGVANRMLGTWAGLGLRYLGLWFTNVVADYLAADCHKVILQDPKDEIIAYPASLRSGVSSFLAVQDNRWSVCVAPRALQISLALFNQKLLKKLTSEPAGGVLSSSFLASPIFSLPSAFKSTPSQLLEPLRQAVSGSLHVSDASTIVSEDLIGYLFACVSAVNLQFRGIAMHRKQNRSRSPQLGRLAATVPSSGASDRSAPTRAAKLALSPLPEDEATETNRLLDDAAHTRSGAPPSVAFDTAARAEVGSFSSSSRTSSSDTSSGGSSTGAAENAPDNAYLSMMADGLIDLNGGGATASDESLLADQELYARHYQSFYTLDPYLHPVEKLWFILTRLDFDDGQALGPAFKRGFDTFRVWLTNSLIWSAQYRLTSAISDVGDHTKPLARSSTAGKVGTPTSQRSGGSGIASANRNRGLLVDASLTLNQYLEAYRAVYADFASSLESHDPEGVATLTRRADLRLCDMLLFIVDAFSLVGAYCAASRANSGIERTAADVEQGVSGGTVDGEVGRVGASGQSYQRSGSAAASARIGHTITFHTGHSGWPSDAELNSLKAEMRLAGFHV